jgi:hypothetical protein
MRFQWAGAITAPAFILDSPAAISEAVARLSIL